MPADRFEFGENWARFLQVVDEERVAEAERSLTEMLDVPLAGRRFLDIGSGSGLFSLAARRLGAVVHSFDYDEQSVACTEELRRRFRPGDAGWTIERGSALDAAYLESLGLFDVVYSWGVLHHTGDQWTALDLAVRRVTDGGRLFVALYNDQGVLSRYWALVKRTWNQRPAVRPVIIGVHAPWFVGVRGAVRAARGRLGADRGMSLWYDLLDWLGGYPFEVSTPGAVVDAVRARGLHLERLTTVGGRHGCNQFVFSRP